MHTGTHAVGNVSGAAAGTREERSAVNVDVVVAWYAGFYWAGRLFEALRFPLEFSRGWIPVSVVGVILSAAGLLLVPAQAGLSSLVFLILFGLIPESAFRQMQRWHDHSEYEKASRLARFMRWLHPSFGWRELDDMTTIARSKRDGRFEEALELVQRYESADTIVGRRAAVEALYLRSDWQGTRELLETELGASWLEHDRALLFDYLRALGETGDLNALVESFHRHLGALQGDHRLLVQSLLITLAFCGRRELAARLVRGGRGMLQGVVVQTWLATADLAAGDEEKGRAQFKALLDSPDARTRLTAERRLSAGSARAADVLNPVNEQTLAQLEEVVDELAKSNEMAERQSQRATATGLLIALNLMVFGLQLLAGDPQDPEALFRAGAIRPAAVVAGQWWRVLVAPFLHAGWAHLVVNLLVIYHLGSVLEYVLGWKRYVFLYLISGIGSSVLLLTVERLVVVDLSPETTVFVAGSGSALAVAGGTIAAWRHLKRTLGMPVGAADVYRMVILAAAQVPFSLFVLQVVATDQVSGVLLGFVVATVMLRE